MVRRIVRLILVTAALTAALWGSGEPAAAGEFGACLGGGGWVSSWNDGGHWQHYCNGGVHDGMTWLT